MSSKISTSDISNIHIYKETTRPRKLDLCEEHRSELSDYIADKLDELVTTRLFQSKFKDFLPDPDSNEEVRVKIRIAKHKIVVQKINREGTAIGHRQTVSLEDLEEEDDVEEINHDILETANRIYQDHLTETDESLSRKTKPIDNQRNVRIRSTTPTNTRHHRHPRDLSSDQLRHGRQPHRSHERYKCEHDHSPIPTNTRHHRLPRRRYHRSASLSPSLPRLNRPHRRSHFPLYGRVSRHPSHRHRSPSDTRRRHAHHHSETLTRTHHHRTGRNRYTGRLKDGRKYDRSRSLSPTFSQPLRHKRRKNIYAVETEFDLLDQKTSPIKATDFDQLMQLSQTLSSPGLLGSSHFPEGMKEDFMKLPEAIRNSIYYQTYLLVDPLESSNPWPVGQNLFEATSADSATNLCRAHAIRHYLLHMLAIDFAHAEGDTPPQELLRRFAQLPEEDKREIYKQLEYIQPAGSGKNPVKAFAGELLTTNRDRGTAINRVVLDRIAEYQRHHHREVTQALKDIFVKALAKS